MLNELKYNPLNIALFILLNSINIFVENRVIIKIFKINQKKELKLFIVQSILKIMISLFLPISIYILVDILIKLFLYKIFLKLKSEKLYIAVIFSEIIKTISENMFLIKNLYISSINLTYIVEIAVNLVVIICLKYKKYQITLTECLNEKVKNKITAISLISIILILAVKVKIIGDIEQIPSYLYLLFSIMQIAYLVVLIKNILSMLKQNDAKIKIENLEGSNKRLQENYDSVRAFKHDFNNIMQGLGGYIIAKDFEGLNKMYKSIINECQEINEKQSINQDIISNPAILNLINNKIKEAEKKSIKIKLEVYIDLNTLKVPTYDLCRILGILIDNAIEACTGCETKVISIKFLRDKYNNRNLIIIENPYKNYLIDVKKIYEKGFSSKKDKISHGLGLWKVKQILSKNKNIQIYTSREKLFKQQLEIY